MATRERRAFTMKVNDVTADDKHPPQIVAKEVIASTRWLQLVKLTWRDGRGGVMQWDAAERPGFSPSGPPFMSPQASAVAILPIVRRAGFDSEVVLITQFRPALGKICIEAPAGLVDPNEKVEEAATRELLEETGLRAGKVLDEDETALCNDPGITNAACKLIIVEVDGDTEENRASLKRGEEGKLFGVAEEGEAIQVLRLPLKNLRGQLNEMIAQGMAVDGKLHCFA
ncbi:hypothetical protein GUITHDRAFT_166567, partial [Guillardia theta CCMP2712]